MAEKRIVCFQSKQVKICKNNSDNYYIYLKRYSEIFVINDCVVQSAVLRPI